MIYLKRYNICFIRIPKTASSSVMNFLYENVCDETDVASRMFEWNQEKYEKKYHINCPVLPHSHVDARYVIENGIVPETATFIGTIRNPIEKQLSLYLYRIRDGRYGPIKPSIAHFRGLFKNGILEDKPQQMQSQFSFLEYNNIKTKWWLYDRIEEECVNFCNDLGIEIKSNMMVLNKSPGNTKKLIDVFYTNEMKSQVREQYSEDFKLYETLISNIK